MEGSGMSKEDADEVISLVARAMLIVLNHYLRLSDAVHVIAVAAQHVEGMCIFSETQMGPNQPSRPENSPAGQMVDMAKSIYGKLRNACSMKGREIQETGDLGKRNPLAMQSMEETSISPGVTNMGTSYPNEPFSHRHPQSIRSRISDDNESIPPHARQTTTTRSVTTTHTVIENNQTGRDQVSQEHNEEKTTVEETVRTQVAQV